MFILISYDIRDDKKRTRFANRLKDFGKRVQLSVFEAEVGGGELDRLRKIIAAVELEEEDTIRMYRLCADCIGKIALWGAGEVTRDKDFFIV